jgi:uncharacterized membrane-anchored protein YhcB (DUF1043 family)
MCAAAVIGAIIVFIIGVLIGYLWKDMNVADEDRRAAIEEQLDEEREQKFRKIIEDEFEKRLPKKE